MTNSEKPAMRRDAAENRARILRESAAVFAEHGPDADVREIARAAGVGMGTLYRHFPTKQALLHAVIHRNAIEWAEATLAAPRDDPWTDLRRFFENALSRHAANRALLDSFGADVLDPETVRESRRRIRPVIEQLVVRAQGNGSLRDDVTPVDVHLLLMALGRIVNLGPAAWQRQLDIALDGLRNIQPTSLRTPPMDYERFYAASSPPPTGS